MPLPATLSQASALMSQQQSCFSGACSHAAESLVANLEENPMKTLVSMIVAAGLAGAFATPILAADKMPTTKAACVKANMKWDDATKTCSKSSY